jgi:hypothetical protein
LANHLGLAPEQVVRDLGWDKLRQGFDSLVDETHVDRLCTHYNRPRERNTGVVRS